VLIFSTDAVDSLKSESQVEKTSHSTMPEKKTRIENCK